MTDIFAVARDCEGRGQLADAIAEYTRLIENGVGGSVALTRRALLRNQLGSFSGMTADLEHAQAIGPHDPYPWMWQGHIAKTMRRPYFAASCLQMALACSPPFREPEMRVNLADIYLVLGWLDSAARLARGLAHDVIDWWAGTRRTALERYQERHASTRAVLRECRTTSPSRALRLDLAARMLSLGRLKVAGKLCEALMREEPRDFTPFELQSRVVARERGSAEGLAFLHAIGWLHRGSHGWIAAVARLLLDLGRFDELQALLNEIDSGSLDEELRILLGFALIVAGDFTQLGTFCSHWMLAAPESVPAGGLLVSVFSALNSPSTMRRSVPPSPRRQHIVHFWHDLHVPNDVQAALASWRTFNPELDATVFSAKAATEFFASRYDSETLAAFKLCHHPSMQADLFRLAFLAREGGLYADADEVCLSSVQTVIGRAAEVELLAVASGEIPNFLHNYFLGGRAGSPTLCQAVSMAANSLLRAAQEGRQIDIWHVTGPGLLTRAAGRMLAERLDSVTTADVALLPLQQYRALVRVAHELAYKHQPATNWRLS